MEYETYDPDNLDLMRTLLCEGLDYLAEYPHFVLPNLPNVHCVPLLLDWICAPYGKRYFPEELKQKFIKDKFVMGKVGLMLRELTSRCHPTHRRKLSKLQDQQVKKFSVALLGL